MTSPHPILDWQDYFNRYLESFSEPSEKDLFMGETTLRENPVFASAWLSWIAIETGSFLSLPEFEIRFKKVLSPPRKPLIDPPSRKNVPKSAHLNFVAKETEFRQAQNDYRRKRLRYEDEQDALDTFKSTYTKDHTGYLRFLQDATQDDLKSFLSSRQRIPIPDADRYMHTYISGGTGSGKTESIKAIIHHHVVNDPDSAVVVLDPHGELCLQVAQFKELYGTDRLAYIDPKIFPNHHPVFNPFDIPDEVIQNEDTLDVFSQELTEQFVMSLGEGSEATENMKAILSPCITTLLMMPNGNFEHLAQFMSPKENKGLLQFAKNKLHNTHGLRVLQEYLQTVRIDTRQGIVHRVGKLIGKSSFARVTCAPSTIDLEEAIQQKKIIIFNLSSKSLGKEGSTAFGRLVMAKLFSIATMRDLENEPETQHVPIHLFIDECQKYCTKTVEAVLTEARKYGLYATLANQSSENIKDKDVKDAILSNTNVKMVGREGVATYRKKNAENIGADPNQIADLAVGNFIVSYGRMSAFTTQVGTDLLKYKNSMTPEQWEETLAEQKQRYYRPKNKESCPPPTEPKDILDTSPLPDPQISQSPPSGEISFNVPKKK